MSIHVATGLPGSGKSGWLAKTFYRLLARNKKWQDKTGIRRAVASNMKIADYVEEHFGLWENGGLIKYWHNADEIPELKDADVIIEELSVYTDSRKWDSMSPDMRRWWQQHRHRGCEIWANVQEFADIDTTVRRLTSDLTYIIKLWGSRDPSPTTPPVKYIWGVMLELQLNPRGYKEDLKFVGATPSGIWFNDRDTVELYDMFNDIKAGTYPPYQHMLRECKICGFKHVHHV